MDLNFLKDMIEDETRNAKEYATAALEHRTSHPKWAGEFMRMSKETEQNVDCLYKIMDEMREEEKHSPVSATYTPSSFDDNEYKKLVDDYADKKSKMRSMREMYYRR